MSILKTIEQSEKEFEERFSNPDKLDSSSQFNPEFAGKLYPEINKWHKAQQIKLLEAVVKWGEKNYRNNGDCKNCSGKVSNWNCKQHAYIDLSQELTSVINKLKGEK